jgi:hypothetical protein
MIKRIIKLAILLAIVNAGYRTIPVYIRYVKFRDAVTDMARFSGGQTQPQVRERVAALISQYEVPVDIADVTIDHQKTKTAIDASYVEAIEVFPSYIYYWNFDVNLDVAHVRPTSLTDIR